MFNNQPSIPRTVIPTLYAIGDGTGSWQTPEKPDWPHEHYRQQWQQIKERVLKGKYPKRFAGLFRKFKKHDAHWAALLSGDGNNNRQQIEAARAQVRVGGGFMERLPLACLKYGLVDYAEKWHYINNRDNRHYGLEKNGHGLFAWRGFYLHNQQQPYAAAHMRGFWETFGVPHILCVYGLGISEELLRLCKESFKIYYSIDAPALRVPPGVSKHFNLVLVGDKRQQEKVRRTHPGMPCEILTTGPDFADTETFSPLNIPKKYDLIYVACAQPYKRHDILFGAMAKLKNRRPVNCLCICGYGELTAQLRRQVRELDIAVTIIGPPGVSHRKVNEYINQGRVGIVAGVEDGCPAIISEYMLAGIPVLANAGLCCGLRLVKPETGWVYPEEYFADGILRALNECNHINPRPFALEHCGWPASVRQLEALLHRYGYRK